MILHPYDFCCFSCETETYAFLLDIFMRLQGEHINYHEVYHQYADNTQLQYVVGKISNALDNLSQYMETGWGTTGFNYIIATLNDFGF